MPTGMPDYGFNWKEYERVRRERRREYAARLSAKYPHLDSIAIQRIVERKIR